MPAWSLVRVFGSWVLPIINTPPHNQWQRQTGKWTAHYPGPITNQSDGNMWVGGLYDSRQLSIEDGVLTFDAMLPATDDPSIQQAVKLTLTFTFDGDKGTPRIYVIDVPMANRPVVDGGNGEGVNLINFAQTGSIGPAVALYGVGVPGGLAKLSPDGLSVLDAFGNPISGGGGGGPVNWGSIGGLLANQADLVGALGGKAALAHTHVANDITNATVVGKNVMTAATQLAARTAIGAGIGNSDLVLGTTAGTALEGDTPILALGTTAGTAMEGDTPLLELGPGPTEAMPGDTTIQDLGGVPTIIVTQAAMDALLLAGTWVPGVQYLVNG